ncbi:hypothetical protein D3C77_617930 [compost metagenome]
MLVQDALELDDRVLFTKGCVTLPVRVSVLEDAVLELARQVPVVAQVRLDFHPAFGHQ